MVQKVVRRKVALRISVTEQEIDRYLRENREKLETGLTFEARHMLFLPETGRGEDGWDGGASAGPRRSTAAARRAGLGRAGPEVLGGSRRRKDGGGAGHAQARRAGAGASRTPSSSRPGRRRRRRSGPRWAITSSSSTRKRGARPATRSSQARAQIREILFREKYDVRLKDWLEEISSARSSTSATRRSRRRGRAAPPSSARGNAGRQAVQRAAAPAIIRLTVVRGCGRLTGDQSSFPAHVKPPGARHLAAHS